ncbi:RNA polymerase sigma factor, partial [Streptomyces sp. NPDC001193]
MNSSNQESPAQRTGAHRAHGRTPPAGPPERPEGLGADPAGAEGFAGPAGAVRSGSPEREQPTAPPPFRHEPYLDGLFTYCLSVLCDHDAATDVLADVLAVAERHPGRCPDEGDRRAWLYALARWACLRRLAEHRPSSKPRWAPSAGSARRRSGSCCGRGIPAG